MLEGAAIDLIYRLIVTPLIGFLLWTWKRQQLAIDELKERQAKSEQSHAVILVMVENIKDDIKEIKYGIEKMLDRRQYQKPQKHNGN